MSNHARLIAHDYFRHWTEGRFADAIALLHPALVVEVPINAYSTREDFGRALAAFGAMVERTEMLSELGDAHEAMQLYDMHAQGLGTLRIAEHFTVEGAKIVRLRQIHDTAPMRAAGLGS